MEIYINDAQGRRVYSSGEVGQDGEVDINAYFYRSIPTDRSGNDVWRHDLFNMIGDKYRNTIPPGGTDIVTIEFGIPSWAISPIYVSAALKYRKLNKRYTNWVLERNDVNLPIIDMARDSLTIPLKLQPNLKKSNLGATNVEN
jgi:hypothetical protein